MFHLEDEDRVMRKNVGGNKPPKTHPWRGKPTGALEDIEPTTYDVDYANTINALAQNIPPDERMWFEQILDNGRNTKQYAEHWSNA